MCLPSGKKHWSKKDKGLFYLWAEFVSYTKEWDLTPKSQSFCRLSQSYTEVLYEVLYEYPQKDIWDEITQGQAIKDMLLQYEETDWEFLKRLASHFSTFLVADSSADCGRAYFGIPNINYGTDLLLEEY